MARTKLEVAWILRRAARSAIAPLLLASAVVLAAEACADDEGIAPPDPTGGTGGNGPDASNPGDATGGTAGNAGAGGTSGGASGTSGGRGGAGGGSAGNAGSGGTSGGAGGMGGGAAGVGGTGAAGAAGAPDAGGSDTGGGVDAGNGMDSSGSDVGTLDVAADGDVSRPPCMASPNQVVVLGDSYVNWISHTFPADLAKEAGVTYRMYAVGGTAMGSGGIGLIPPQLDQAVTADPNIIAVVMDGGGNDVLVADTVQFPQGADCKNNAMSPSIADCQKIVQKAVDAAVAMMNTAADKGIKDVVYFFYPHVPEGTLIGGAHPNAILDYALPRVKATCDEARTRTQGRLTCHFLDLIPVFDGHPDWFAATDIHPNPSGSAAMAKAVVKTMKDACIAQPASSGCCRP